MDSLQAMMMGELNRGNPRKVFDWDAAARMLLEHDARGAAAGLDEDWHYTGGDILADGEPLTGEYTYLASTWATPVLEIDDRRIPCYIEDKDVPPEWLTGEDGNRIDCSDVKWPRSALAIMKGGHA